MHSWAEQLYKNNGTEPALIVAELVQDLPHERLCKELNFTAAASFQVGTALVSEDS